MLIDVFEINKDKRFIALFVMEKLLNLDKLTLKRELI